MCEFCHQHGEGERWYLEAKNYGEDLLSDISRREYIRDFFSNPERMDRTHRFFKVLQSMPSFIQRAVKKRVEKRQEMRHIGQVVPLQEVERIFSFVNSIVRLNCFCRQTTAPLRERENQRYCYGVSMGDDGGELREIIKSIDRTYLHGPHTAGLEVLDREEAMADFSNHEEEGLCHTVWTFHTPFIGGICNCDLKECHALQVTMEFNTQVVWPGEYRAKIHKRLCTNCQRCIYRCQFGAIKSGEGGTLEVDPSSCYGCGLCISSCPARAMELYAVDRYGVQ